MTAQGHPVVRFRRAVESRNIVLAEVAAREMPRVLLDDALDLVLLYAEKADPKFERAAVRWLCRAAEELPVGVREVAIIAHALAELRGPMASRSADLLRGLSTG